MLSVLKYSVYKNFRLFSTSLTDIVSFITDVANLNDELDKINNRINELNYNPNSIDLKKLICDELYKNGKYYLG